VLKNEFHTQGSKPLIAFQAIYRVIEMTGKDSKTSLQIPYYSVLLSSYWIFIMQDKQREYIKYKTTFMTD
jgi:hypothetical protein